MKTEYEVIDNFLDKEYFEELKKIVMGEEVPWFWGQVINDKHTDSKDLTSFFQHTLFHQSGSIVPAYYQHFIGFWVKLRMKAVIRMKLNLYPKTDKIEIHERHIDFDYDHKGCLFSFNTCDGFTQLEDGTKIASVENRALLFNPGIYHNSSTTTNEKARLNLNINYF